MRISDWSSDVCSSDLHVERDHRRQAERDQFEREAEMIVEIGGIDDDDQRVGTAFARLSAEDDVARPRLVGAGRSAERRVGKECVSPCRSRRDAQYYKNTIITIKVYIRKRYTRI